MVIDAHRTDRDTVTRLQRLAGNTAVTGMLSAHPATVQRQPKKARGIVVHPASKLSADEIVRQLKKNKNVPDFLKKSLFSKNGAIVIPANRVPKAPANTFSDFLQPFIDAMTSPDWQITTATSTIEVKGTPPDKLTFSQVVTPHLSKGQRLGSSVKTGPDEKTFMADNLFSRDKEVIFGWTVPASSTEQLKTSRGLVVIVTKITVTDPQGRKKAFTPTQDEVLESVMHEIAAHAGRITAGLPDTHGTRAVEDIADDIAKFFRYSDTARGVVPFPTATRIFEFVGARPAPKP
jgi:hypothetical protein